MLSASMNFRFSPQPPSLSSQDSSKFFVSSVRACLLRKADADGFTSKASPTEGPGEGSSMMALSRSCIRSGSI
jgi:hypothetical protein